MTAKIRLGKVLKTLNISLDRAIEKLKESDVNIDRSPNAKITQEQYDLLVEIFQPDMAKKQQSEEFATEMQKEKEVLESNKQKKEDNHIIRASKPSF